MKRIQTENVQRGYGIGWVLGVVIWIDEEVFIRSKGTRIPLIGRIRTDLGVLIKIFLLSMRAGRNLEFAPVKRIIYN
jgi:hypothetical protein